MPSKTQRIVMPMIAPLGQAIFMGSVCESASSAVPNSKCTTIHPNASTPSLKLIAEESTSASPPRAKREKRTPYFVLAREQHSTLKEKGRAVESVTTQADVQLVARLNALSVTYRLQAQSRLMTQH